MELLKKIQTRYSHFSKNQKTVADYIAGHGIESSFDSIMELGQKIGVSEASIVRFAQQLGFEGYPKFCKALQEDFRKTFGNAARLNDAVTGLNNQVFLTGCLKTTALDAPRCPVRRGTKVA